jgi:hypothetical protein
MTFDASMWQLAHPLAVACAKSVLLCLVGVSAQHHAHHADCTIPQPFCKVSYDQVKGSSVSCMQREWMVACAQSSVFVIRCAQGEPTAVVQCCKRLFEHNATALLQHQGMIVKGKDSLPQLSRLTV